ncbi:MAG: RNA polymerase factor sigma-54 [PVC group bacterium]|nr:RNA polymerase factor sigma-54 [PVC group bacterium]
MELHQRLQQKQVQKLIMTAKMQQSMHILQLPILELNQLIAEELATNPVIEEEIATPAENTPEENKTTEPSPPVETEPTEVDQKIIDDQKNNANLELDWLSNDNIWSSEFVDKNRISQSMEKHDFQQTLITKSITIQEELTQQFRLINTDEDDRIIAEQIIGSINENGYLPTSTDEIAQSLNCTVEKVDEILKQIQELEPSGVAARDLKECLLIQLKRNGKEDSPEATIVAGFLPELAAKKYQKISKALKISLPQIKKYVYNISRLDPKPCRNYSQEALRIVPDILLEKTSDNYEIIINTKNIPQFSISKLYKKMLKDKSCPEETLKFIKEKLKSAENLISGLTQRQLTLKKVTSHIIEYQQDFLEKGISDLKPLKLKEIAELMQVHPSTISRTVANKYIQTPHGTFALKNFFSQSIASENGDMSSQKVKVTIDEMVKTESPQTPLSDQQIVDNLAKQGIHISRRAVTKYRNALKIPSSHLRRRS